MGLLQPARVVSERGRLLPVRAPCHGERCWANRRVQADLSGVQDLDVVLIRSRVVVGNGLSLDYYVS